MEKINLITDILWFFGLAVALGLSILFALRRGPLHTGIKLACVPLELVGAWFLTGFLAGFLKLDFLANALFERLGSVFQNESVRQILEQLPAALLKPFVFTAVFFVLKILMDIILFIIFKIAKKGKEKPKGAWRKAVACVLGILITLACAGALLVPTEGTAAMAKNVGEWAGEVSGGSEVPEKARIGGSLHMRMFRSLLEDKVYDGLATVEVNGKKCALRKELPSLLSMVRSLVKLTGQNETMDAALSVIGQGGLEHIMESLTDPGSVNVSDVLSGDLSSITDKFSDIVEKIKEEADSGNPADPGSEGQKDPGTEGPKDPDPEKPADDPNKVLAEVLSDMAVTAGESRLAAEIVHEELVNAAKDWKEGGEHYGITLKTGGELDGLMDSLLDCLEKGESDESADKLDFLADVADLTVGKTADQIDLESAVDLIDKAADKEAVREMTDSMVQWALTTVADNMEVDAADVIGTVKISEASPEEIHTLSEKVRELIPSVEELKTIAAEGRQPDDSERQKLTDAVKILENDPLVGEAVSRMIAEFEGRNK